MNTSTFDIAGQDGFVQRHGDTVLWSQAFKCPCSAEADANRANPNCAGCRGTGFIYSAALPLTGLVTGIHHEKRLMEAGLVVPGDLMLGLAPSEAIRLGDYDVIRLTEDEGVAYEGDLLVRGAGATDKVKFDVVNVVRCFVIDSATGGVTDYTLGTDFTVSGRVVTWITGHGPAVGRTYSLKYDMATDWVCFVTPMQRFEGGTSLGRKAIMKKRALPATGTTA